MAARQRTESSQELAVGTVHCCGDAFTRILAETCVYTQTCSNNVARVTGVQAAEPWTGYRHHAAFKGTLPAAAVVTAEALSAACLLAPALLLLRAMPPAPQPGRPILAADYGEGSAARVEGQRLGRSVAASGVAAAIWVVSIVAAGRGGMLSMREQTQLAWLPALPLALSGLAVSVARLQAGSAAAVAALQAQMYCHEKA